MKNLRIALIVTLLFTGITQTQAQFFETLKSSPLIIGVGWNIVDDDGKPWQIVNTSEWNLKPFPSSLKIEKYYQDGFSFVFKGSYNKLNPTPTDIQGGGEVSTFLSLDLGAQYNINEKWFNFKPHIFDVYAALGAGYTVRNTGRVGNVPTLNIGFGMNAFIYNGWGINLEATGKFGLVSPIFTGPANYVHYNFGVIKKFGSKRERVRGRGDLGTSPGLSEVIDNKEEDDKTSNEFEEVNVIDSMKTDSIVNEDPKIIEEPELSEDEILRQEVKKVKVVDEIALDQVTLKENDFLYIDDIIALLKKFPNATLEVHGHADGKRNIEKAKIIFKRRGLTYSKEAFDKMSIAHNQKLSKRRAQYAADYIIGKGVNKESLTVIGHGESKPIAPNFLSDGSDNPEGRKLNRRVEFKIILK